MDVNTLISRLRSALGKKTKYKSPGVTPPLDASAWPGSGAKIDCSGFLAWGLRRSRIVDHPLYKHVNGGWFETTGIHADVLAPTGFFESLKKPVVGAFLVYPDMNGHDGHIGVVTEVNGKKGIAGVDKIIHCSSGAWKKKKDAIQETGPKIWTTNSQSVIGWYSDLS